MRTFLISFYWTKNKKFYLSFMSSSAALVQSIYFTLLMTSLICFRVVHFRAVAQNKNLKTSNVEKDTRHDLKVYFARNQDRSSRVED